MIGRLESAYFNQAKLITQYLAPSANYDIAHRILEILALPLSYEGIKRAENDLHIPPLA